jgi:signal transduction histidine kinase
VPSTDPMPSRPSRSALAGFLWLLVLQPLWAMPFALFFGLMMGGTWPVYLTAFRISLVFSSCVGLSLWAVKHFVEPRLRGRAPQGRDLGLRIGLTYAAGSLLASYVAATIVHFGVLPGFLGTTRSFLMDTMFTLLFVALFSGINFAIAFYRVAVDQARAIEAQRAELARAELRALRAQIQPHFLFNTRNTSASLIAERPAEAEDTTLRLADLFRHTLEVSGREHQPLGDELRFLRDYLGIERSRFGDRLRVHESVEPGLEDAQVPSLLLQPLVENAVRHGIAPRVEGGTLTLRARRGPGSLVVEIQDDGPGFDPAGAEGSDGFGLRSVRERLRLAGPPHAIDIDSSPGRGTCVRVTLPLAAPPRPPVPGGRP